MAAGSSRHAADADAGIAMDDRQQRRIVREGGRTFGQAVDHINAAFTKRRVRGGRPCGCPRRFRDRCTVSSRLNRLDTTLTYCTARASL